PETLAWEDLKEQWRADERGLRLERDAHFAARDARRKQARTALDRALIEQMVDDVTVRVSDPREPHHREGHEKYTVDAILFEEQRVLDMIDEADNRSRLDVRTDDLGDLSPDQGRAIRNIATSP